MSTRIHKYTTVNNKQELRDKAIDNINVSVMLFLCLQMTMFPTHKSHSEQFATVFSSSFKWFYLLVYYCLWMDFLECDVLVVYFMMLNLAKDLISSLDDTSIFSFGWSIYCQPASGAPAMAAPAIGAAAYPPARAPANGAPAMACPAIGAAAYPPAMTPVTAGATAWVATWVRTAVLITGCCTVTVFLWIMGVSTTR